MRKSIFLAIVILVMVASCTKDNKIVVKSDFENQIAIFERSSNVKYDKKVEDSILSWDSKDARSLVMRDLMDVRLIELAKYLSTRDNPTFGLSQLNLMQSIHSWDYKVELENRGQSDLYTEYFAGSATKPIGDINFSAVDKYKEMTGGYVMDCSGFAAMNVSILSWIDDSIPMTIVAGGGGTKEHVIALADVEGKILVMDNNNFYTYKDGICSMYFATNAIEDTSVEKMGLSVIKKVEYLNNLDSYVPMYNATSVSMNSDSLDLVNQVFDKNLVSDSTATKYFNLDLSKGNAQELSDDLMLQLYRVCAKDGADLNYEYSKYAYHTILVKNPEYYIKAYIGEKPNGRKYVNADILNDFLKSTTDLENLIQEAKSFGKESIYKESHRIMTPEYILLFKTADLKSMSFFMQDCLDYLNYVSFAMITDKKAYVAIVENNQVKYLDLSSFEYVEQVEGTVKLLLNRDEVYYPLMEKNTLTEVSKELFGAYIVE